MQVILLERIERLGQMGDVVTVKSGFARNFLLPQNKALRATAANEALFEAKKQQLEVDNAERKVIAEKLSKKVVGQIVTVIRQASDGGQLYGSVSSRDIADDLNVKASVSVTRDQVRVDRSFKMLGLYPVKIVLHPEVFVEIQINIARSVEEAAVQIKENLVAVSAKKEESLAEAAVKAVEKAEAVEKANEDKAVEEETAA